MNRSRVAGVATGLMLGALVVSGCTSGGSSGPPTVTTTTVITSTATVTTSPSAFQPPPATTVAPLPPGASPAVGETEGTCPYIASGPEENLTTNVADILGSHVYRTTVVTTTTPVGCRFYFYSTPYGAIADIMPTKFGSAVEARNAMIRTGEQGSQVNGLPSLAPGVQGVSYRTAFYGPDDGRDWACAFAAGTTLVVVHTQRTDTAQVAVLLAQAVAGKF